MFFSAPQPQELLTNACFNLRTTHIGGLPAVPPHRLAPGSPAGVCIAQMHTPDEVRTRISTIFSQQPEHAQHRSALNAYLDLCTG